MIAASPAATASSPLVVFASSTDDRFPPDAAVDGNPRTFWTSTGMFPQELVLKLAAPATPRRITLLATKVKDIEIYAATADSLSDPSLPSGTAPSTAATADAVLDPFDLVTSLQVPAGQSRISVPVRVAQPVSYLKLVIAAGHHDFVSVHSMDLE
ncbi:Heat shock protein beta-11 [Blastocladiella emersonii ATCC 22665]|nr:Heat shock protein beta-11 [Blastocladiella emersonii ATCC 22665]